MRTLRTMGFLVAGLAVACGSDGGSDKPPEVDAGDIAPADGTNDDMDSGTEEPARACEMLDGFNPWEETDDTLLTEDQWRACDEACGDATTQAEFDTCATANCAPNAVIFYGCIDDTLYSCFTEEGQGCRDQWNGYACCFDDKCSEVTTDEEASACIQGSCGEEVGAIGPCINAEIQGQTQSAVQCVGRIYQLCVEAGTDAGTPEPDAGVTDGGVLDAGTDVDAGATDGGVTDASTNGRPRPRAFVHPSRARVQSLSRFLR